MNIRDIILNSPKAVISKEIKNKFKDTNFFIPEILEHLNETEQTRHIENVINTINNYFK